MNGILILEYKLSIGDAKYKYFCKYQSEYIKHFLTNPKTVVFFLFTFVWFFFYLQKKIEYLLFHLRTKYNTIII